jgi:hypothetical protein
MVARRWHFDVSRDQFDELDRLYPKCVRQSDDVKQTNIAFTSFYPADVVAVEIRQLGQDFLRKAALCPQFADALAK